MVHALLVDLRAQLWDPCGMASSVPVPEPDSANYGGHTLTLNGRPTIFRAAKTTPTKTGQFATLWRRSPQGPIRPFDVCDGVSLFIVYTGGGLFVFPAHALAAHNVLSTHGVGGKRALRLYPPDVVTTSVQARKSQTWQGEYFLSLPANPQRAKRLHAA